MNNKLTETFKSLIYADMAINQAYVGNPFNNKWRENLSEEDKLFLINHASNIAKAERDK